MSMLQTPNLGFASGLRMDSSTRLSPECMASLAALCPVLRGTRDDGMPVRWSHAWSADAICEHLVAQALVASPGKGMQAERIRLASELWAADVAAEFGYKANPNFKDSLQQADDAGTPFVLVLGESELKEVCALSGVPNSVPNAPVSCMLHRSE